MEKLLGVHPPPRPELLRDVSVHAYRQGLTLKLDIREGLITAGCGDNGSLPRLGGTRANAQGDNEFVTVFVNENFHAVKLLAFCLGK